MSYVYLGWNTENKMNYSQYDLKRLHRAFSHPTTDKLVNFLKLARTHEVDAEPKDILERIK